MAHLTIRLLDCTFAKPCQYFVSLQLDENKKRLRTKVSAETDKPTFEETFRTLDFEEDFAIMSPDRIQRTLTLDAFVVLARESATAAHQMLGSATVVLPDLSPRGRRADAGSRRRRRGRDVDLPWRRIRVCRDEDRPTGTTSERSTCQVRADSAAAGTWIFRGDEERGTVRSIMGLGRDARRSAQVPFARPAGRLDLRPDVHATAERRRRRDPRGPL